MGVGWLGAGQHEREGPRKGNDAEEMDRAHLGDRVGCEMGSKVGHPRNRDCTSNCVFGTPGIVLAKDSGNGQVIGGWAFSFGNAHPNTKWHQEFAGFVLPFTQLAFAFGRALLIFACKNEK